MTSSNDSTPAAPAPSIGTAPAGGGLYRGRWRLSAALFAVRLAIGRVIWWFALPADLEMKWRPAESPAALKKKADVNRIIDRICDREFPSRRVQE